MFFLVLEYPPSLTTAKQYARSERISELFDRKFSKMPTKYVKVSPSSTVFSIVSTLFERFGWYEFSQCSKRRQSTFVQNSSLRTSIKKMSKEMSKKGQSFQLLTALCYFYVCFAVVGRNGYPQSSTTIKCDFKQTFL